MKILVIDDNVLLVRMMTRVLAADGHEVVAAKEGGRGMALFRESRPDLVITDIVMPGQEGFETILMLRRDDNRVKIIAISGADMEMLETARLIGADDILEKPFRAHDLVSRVRALDDNGGGSQGPRA
jgi:DNA-binding response OmpR family regulator